MDPATIGMIVYGAITLAREIRGAREDMRKLNPDVALPPLEPLPDDIKAAAAEFAKAHGLALPGEGA